jgi:putative ABC transport system permease protein
MLKNYLRVALRNLTRDKAFSFINISGFAVGVACCIAIMLFMQDELSYDRFNEFASQTYRPTMKGTMNGHEINGALSPAGMGPALFTDLPEVTSYTRLRNFGSTVLRYSDKVFNEGQFLGVDSSFFEVFTVHFLEGKSTTALAQPNSVVLTESMAKKYFGNADPVGKVLNADMKLNWTVTGVIENWPRNSHFKFDFLGSLSTSSDSKNPTWLSNNYYTYLLLRKGTNLVEFQKKLDEEVIKYASPQLKAIAGISLEQFKAAGNNYGYSLQPLASIHLHSHLDSELDVNSDVSYIYIFSAIACAILLIACINFVNLATARSEKRGREVGIRKTLGSNRSSLVRQFLAESVLMSFIAVTLAVVLVELFLPLFNDIAGKEMSLSLFGSPLTVLLILCFAAAVGVIAGIYPAFYLSSFQPVEVLTKGARARGGRSVLRNGLVVFQFAVSIVLIIGTMVIFSQLSYIQTRQLGFDKEQLIVIDRANDLSGRLKTFEEELRSNPNIVSVTNSTAIPGDQRGDGTYQLMGTAGHQYENLQNMWCDYDFAKTYRLNMAEGRFFSREHPSDVGAVVVNEEVRMAYSEKTVDGKYLANPGPPAQKFQIIGVTKDFNYRSLHEAIRPLVIHCLPENGFVGRFITVRIAPGNLESTIPFLEEVWKKNAGDEGFSFNFLDRNLDRLYAADQKTGKIAAIFSVLAIFVASLGLLGLAAFVTERRTKEIGVRKVLGASIPEIILLLSKEFARWVLVANVVAWPAAYFVANNWLKGFAYRVNISIWIFAASGALALIIALLTVCSHAVKAATANPVDSLRYE